MGEPTGLAEEQLRTLDRLKGIPTTAQFYLAGGSAIAFHLHHRRSLDLDFFSFTNNVDLSALRQHLVAAIREVVVLSETDAALRLRIDGEMVDFVRYPYAPLEPPVPGASGFPTARLLDLAVMKLSAIARRGIRRDFWDLHTILGSGVDLKDSGDAYVRRFGVSESDLYHVARSLTYFADAEKDPAFPAGLTAPMWASIMETFRAQAPRLLDSQAT